MKKENLTEFEQQCQEWLNQKNKDLEKGAKLMLQANRNRILHQNVLRKGNLEKIEYELKKYLGNKYKKCNSETISKMEEELAKRKSKQIKENEKGKRDDHDKLSEEIKNLYNRNLEIYPRIKSIYERLKILSGEQFKPCDRYPHLKELLALDEELRQNWEIYDKAVVVKETENKEKIRLTAKEVNAARTYISRAINEIPENIKNGKNQDKRIEKTGEKYKLLIAAGQEVSEETVKGLKSIGAIE